MFAKELLANIDSSSDFIDVKSIVVDLNAVSIEGTTDLSDLIVATGINKNAPCSFLDLDAGALLACKAVSMSGSGHRIAIKNNIAAEGSALESVNSGCNC